MRIKEPSEGTKKKEKVKKGMKKRKRGKAQNFPPLAS